MVEIPPRAPTSQSPVLAKRSPSPQKKTDQTPIWRPARSAGSDYYLTASQFTTRILHVLLAILLAHQLLVFPLFTSLRFGGFLVETALLDLLEQTFLGDGALEALQEFLGVFPASECDTNQVVSLSLGAAGKSQPWAILWPIQCGQLYGLPGSKLDRNRPRRSPGNSTTTVSPGRLPGTGNCRGCPEIWQGKRSRQSRGRLDSARGGSQDLSRVGLRGVPNLDGSPIQRQSRASLRAFPTRIQADHPGPEAVVSGVRSPLSRCNLPSTNSARRATS